VAALSFTLRWWWPIHSSTLFCVTSSAGEAWKQQNTKHKKHEKYPRNTPQNNNKGGENKRENLVRDDAAKLQPAHVVGAVDNSLQLEQQPISQLVNTSNCHHRHLCVRHSDWCASFEEGMCGWREMAGK
jgi:hypothetical protein